MKRKRDWCVYQSVIGGGWICVCRFYAGISDPEGMARRMAIRMSVRGELSIALPEGQRPKGVKK